MSELRKQWIDDEYLWQDFLDYVNPDFDEIADIKQIYSKILVHHMNPITKEDILKRSDLLLNPEYLICTVKRTHDAIHYGDDSILWSDPIERSRNDTCPWKK